MFDRTEGNDGNESERGSSRSLSRRSYLGAAAGAAGMLVGGGGTLAQAASGAEYDTITIGQEEQRVITLGDNETLENTIIDITASGASFRIEAWASDWAIRNVGVKGVWDYVPSGHHQAISARVEDADATGVIENVYFADGNVSTDAGGVVGIYVNKDHAGTLDIKNVNLQEFPNNGIYASSPGKSDGAGGVVQIEDSYFADNLVASVRLGSEGSYARNCVVNGAAHRGFWSYWEHCTFENCDSVATNAWDAGGPTYDHQSTAVAELADCRGDGGLRERNGGEIVGEMGSEPRSDPPAGVPRSAAEAAEGNGNVETESAQSLVIETTSDNPGMSYEFSVDGSITGGDSLESSDSWSESDGTTTATGDVGWGYTDSYTLTGPLTSWTATEDAATYTLLLDGQEIDPSAISADDGTDDTTNDDSSGDQTARLLVIDGSAKPDATARYRFSVSGSVTKDEDRSTVSEGGIAWDQIEDEIAGDTVTGLVGNGVDAYRFTGKITNIDVRGKAAVNISQP
jgi:hypothetical protein